MSNKCFTDTIDALRLARAYLIEEAESGSVWSSRANAAARAAIDAALFNGVAQAPRVQADYAAVVAERDRAIAACELIAHAQTPSAAARIEALEAALRAVRAQINLEKSPKLAAKIDAVLAPEQDK